MLSGGATQLRENALDLVLFFQGEFLELVVQIHDDSRLDEKCGTSGRLVVDHSWDIALVLRFDGDTVAVVAHGDYRVLQVSPIAPIDHVGELAVYLFVGQVDAAPYVL